jgi:hypothetical protein
MLYFIKFVLISQILSVVPFTNYSKINISSPISISHLSKSVGTYGIGISHLYKYIPKLETEQEKKFSRTKNKIKNELLKKIKYRLEESIIEIYESSSEYWLLYTSIHNDESILHIFEVSGKYLEVYEYKLTNRQVKILLEKKKKKELNKQFNYFIENE